MLRPMISVNRSRALCATLWVVEEFIVLCEESCVSILSVQKPLLISSHQFLLHHCHAPEPHRQWRDCARAWLDLQIWFNHYYLTSKHCGISKLIVYSLRYTIKQKPMTYWKKQCFDCCGVQARGRGLHNCSTSVLLGLASDDTGIPVSSWMAAFINGRGNFM